MERKRTEYMRTALELAEKGRGYTSPNPVVGAVIVKDGRIIGRGYHEKYGQLHAERNALAACSESPAGAEMYVTLEPCCHYGKTPPCTEAIIENKIRKVYVGSLDPNPLVAGKGIKILEEAGVEVETGVLKKECDEINSVFFHFIRTGLPYVTLKFAATCDGKIATYSGRSKWITCEESRQLVHRMRHENAGILAGIGTVLADDPLLTCRIEGKETVNPVRIICDTNMRISPESQIVKTAKEIRTILAVGEETGSKEAKERELTAAGVEILKCPEKSGHVNLKYLMQKLGEMKIDSILAEGGGQIAYSLFEEGLINKVMAFTAPKIFGGSGKTPVGGAGVENPAEAFRLELKKVGTVGSDILAEYIVT